MMNDLESNAENERPNVSTESVVDLNGTVAASASDVASNLTSSNENDAREIHNKEANNKKKNDEVALETDANFLDKIYGLHCPFTWKPEEHLKYRHDEIESIMNVDEMFDDTGFKLRRFVIHMILCYNNFAKRQIDESIKHLDEMEKMLLTSMKNKSRDVYFTSINDALFHIMQSCRVVMLNETNQKEKALQILKKITLYDDLNDCNKAGIWAVRANLYVEFGYLGVKAAIEFIKKATTIDERNPYWYFTKGVYLGRLRRLENGLAIPSVDEVSALEFALKLKEDPAFMAFAAEVYTETANRSMKQYQELFSNFKEKQKNQLLEHYDLLSKHAAMLFKKSVSLNSGCAHLLFRCGKGMLKLPPPHQDLKLARDYIEKGLEISYESSYGNHAMAMYYEKHEKNYEMAKKYLKKAAEQKNFGADIDMIRIEFLENQDAEDLLNKLLKLFEIYPDKLKHRKIIAEIISYFLFIKYNLTEAINYMKKLLYLIDDHDDIVNIHKSGILRQKLPVSLLNIMLSDITDRSNRKNLTEEEEKLCKEFLKQLCFLKIELPAANSQNLRKKVVSEIKANFKNLQLENAKRSLKKTEKEEKEEPHRKDYNPIENRFTREYAKKYYYNAKHENNEKTVVQEFFEKYEREAEKKAKNLIKDKGMTVDEKQKLKEIVTKLKSSGRKNFHSSKESDLSTDEEDMVIRLAKQFERRFDVSPEAKSSKNGSACEKKSRDRLPSVSKSHRKSGDNGRSRRHSGNADRKRSDSKDSRMSYSSRKNRSTSREGRAKRSVSRESRMSHSSRKNRSTSRDDRAGSPIKCSESRERRKRSVSRDSRMSHSSRRERRSVSRDRRKRSVSRNSHISISSSRKKRSTSRDSRLSYSRRNRSSSQESRKRSTSRDTRKFRRKRSISRDSHVTTRRRRSVSVESHRSRKSDHHRYQKDDRRRYSDYSKSSSTSEERSRDRESQFKTQLTSDRRKDDCPEKHRSNRYKSRKSHSSLSDTECSRISGKSSTRSRKKHGCKYDSDDTLTGTDSSHSTDSAEKSDNNDGYQSKSRSHRYDRYRRDYDHRRSKSPARRSDNRDRYKTSNESRDKKRGYEEKYQTRSSKAKHKSSTGSDHDSSDRSVRSHYSDKSLSYHDEGNKKNYLQSKEKLDPVDCLPEKLPDV